jgi:hypothetical protein
MNASLSNARRYQSRVSPCGGNVRYRVRLSEEATTMKAGRARTR